MLKLLKESKANGLIVSISKNQSRFVRSISSIFRINKPELVKFIPMSLLMFVILLNQNITRGMKDSLIMTMVGPEIVSFIKLFIEMPAGVVFVLFYSKMCNSMSTEKAFRAIVVFFLAYFFVFGFFIFPNIDYLNLSQSTFDSYVTTLPNLRWFITLAAKWPIVLFYVVGEMWPIVIFYLLFWQLANKTTSLQEASRFYPLFSMFGHLNLLFSGKVIVYFANQNHIFSDIFYSVNKSETSVKSLTAIVLLSGLMILVIHRFIEHKMKTNPDVFLTKNNKEHLELSVKDSIKMILSSKYLGMICVICASYHVVINLIEGVWFFNVKKIYGTPELFMNYQGNILFYTGIFTFIVSLFGGYIVKNFSWFFAAVATPMMLALTGIGFFAIVLTQKYLLNFYPYLIVVSLIVFFGSLQNVVGRGTKYSLYDSTKEMLYIPLDEEMKVKGKAAVDIVGTKIGKSLGAIMQSVFFILMPNSGFDSIAHFLMISYVLVCMIWIYNVYIIKDKITNSLYH